MNASYRLVNVSGGRYECQVEGAPAEVVALPSQADALPQLARGRWLVLAFAVWQATDHESVELALEAACEAASAGGLGRRLGLLPFADAAELAVVPGGEEAAAHDLEAPDATPLWLCVDNGAPVEARAGILTLGELLELLR